jgi:CheY-like chemotaxis protein
MDYDNEIPINDETASQEKPVILVVEDDDDLRQFIKSILENEYDVYEASTERKEWSKPSV